LFFNVFDINNPYKNSRFIVKNKYLTKTLVIAIFLKKGMLKMRIISQ